jgi:hypothetical protein
MQGFAPMNTDSALPDGLASYPDDNDAFVVLYDSEAFAEFEKTIDGLIEALVGRWVHLAAPLAAANRIRRATIVPQMKKSNESGP